MTLRARPPSRQLWVTTSLSKLPHAKSALRLKAAAAWPAIPPPNYVSAASISRAPSTLNSTRLTTAQNLAGPAPPNNITLSSASTAGSFSVSRPERLSIDVSASRNLVLSCEIEPFSEMIALT